MLAHALAHGSPTRAVANRADGSYTVFVDGGVVGEGTVAVVENLDPASKRFAIGLLSYPTSGWIEVGGTAYPTDRVAVRGPVLFIVRPVAEEENGHKKHKKAEGGQPR